MIEALWALVTAPFVIFLIGLAIGAVTVTCIHEYVPLCQYCNNDGEPCPRCGGYAKRGKGLT